MAVDTGRKTFVVTVFAVLLFVTISIYISNVRSNLRPSPVPVQKELHFANTINTSSRLQTVAVVNYKAGDDGRRDRTNISTETNKATSIRASSTIQIVTVTNLISETDNEANRGYMQERINHMRRKCESENWQNYSTSVFPVRKRIKIMYNMERRLSFCKVAKAGSTELGRIFMILQNPEKTDEILHYSGNQIHTMSDSISGLFGIYEQKEGWTRFLVSRDPYGRLLSGYLDKIYLMKFPFIAHEIVQKVRGKAALNANSNCVTDITFLEFLKYLIIRSKKQRSLNNHFEPIFAYCNPCSVLYDYILKVESLSTDAEYLLKMFKVEPSSMESTYNLLHDSFVETRIQGVIPSAWSVGYLTYKCFSKIELARRLWRTFQIQGYLRDSIDFREYLFPLNMNDKGMGNVFVEEYLRQNVSKEEGSIQRKRLVSDFYRSIDDRTIHEIQELYRMDFLLFDYDIKPPILET